MSAVSEAVREQGIVAIVRAADAESAARDVATLIDAGLRVVEVSLVTPNAIDVIRTAAASAPDGVLIGVGTAVTAEEVQAAARAGARFVVSPVLRERVLKATLDAGLEALPGVATPTEALQAVDWGSTFVKLFPASLWSPVALREVLTALPALQTVPTGGVTIDTAPEWIGAGAAAVGIGGALTRAADPTGAAHALLETIAAARR
ncbi:bifunctional 4-hydroxy-2-oxoglutarate aldolase/2-dehydro-3-deoxy-phosphogluconate aldolase [uncultured Amnibacterium sp.]|uniref:bifunctional 4-hydroxy-2-oxoglutarate aldolase/2-dehydro-3-deoxy-phosphogluconate aldolase n=1 Tax=uncultured Amnibacterium sp. TaxID=1631851 RepID=UPI0035CBADBB